MRPARRGSLRVAGAAAVRGRRTAGPAGRRRCGAYDVAWWLFPQGDEYLCERLPRTLPLVIGPVATPWPAAENQPRHAGDAVRAVVRPLLRRLHRDTVRRADAMLSVPDAAQVLPVAPRATSVVPFAVDHAKFRYSDALGDPVVLFVGRLEQAKGVADLIEAFPAVLRASPQARLRIAGTGALAGALRDRADELGMNGSVEFLGAVDHAQIPGLLEDCALLAAPSDGEPYGMTVLEAMSAGRAVIAGDNGGPPFLLDGDDGGRLVAPHDIDALAGALVELLADPARLRTMGLRNRTRVEQQFSWDVVLDKVEGVLQSAADRR